VENIGGNTMKPNVMSCSEQLNELDIDWEAFFKAYDEAVNAGADASAEDSEAR
jgi:hypothetical protein